MEEVKHKTITENADSFEIGTPGKGGVMKVYGDYNNLEDFKKKIDKAIELKVYANANIQINI